MQERDTFEKEIRLAMQQKETEERDPDDPEEENPYLRGTWTRMPQQSESYCKRATNRNRGLAHKS